MYADHTVIQLLNELSSIDAIKRFFAEHQYTVVEYPSTDAYSVICINYMLQNKLWNTKWARECRGAVFVLHDGQWTCIKALLPRGVELFAPRNITEGTPPYKENDIFDARQKDTLDRLRHNKPIDTILSMKPDGCLFAISVIEKKHPMYNIIYDYIEKNGSAIQKRFLSHKRLYVFHSQNTYCVSFMESWFYIAFLTKAIGVKDVLTYNNVQEAMASNHALVLSRLDKYEKTSDPSTIDCLSFETICPQRKEPFTGNVHWELAIEYNDFYCFFLGKTEIKDHIVFTPHFACHINLFEEPAYWTFQQASEVENILNDVENVIQGHMTQESFRTKYPSHKPYAMHYEGFIIYTYDGATYDYNKIKTKSYYISHNPRYNTLEHFGKISKNVIDQFPYARHVQTMYSEEHKDALRGIMKSLHEQLPDFIQAFNDGQFIEHPKARAIVINRCKKYQALVQRLFQEQQFTIISVPRLCMHFGLHESLDKCMELTNMYLNDIVLLQKYLITPHLKYRND